MCGNSSIYFTYGVWRRNRGEFCISVVKMKYLLIILFLLLLSPFKREIWTRLTVWIKICSKCGDNPKEHVSKTTLKNFISLYLIWVPPPLCVYVCVCVYVCACACVCVCMCACECVRVKSSISLKRTTIGRMYHFPHSSKPTFSATLQLVKIPPRVLWTDTHTHTHTPHYHSHSFLSVIFTLLFNSFPTANAIKSHHTRTVANKFDLFEQTHTETSL